MYKKIISIVILVAMIFSVGVVQAASDFSNGSFENLDNNKMPTGWGFNSYRKISSNNTENPTTAAILTDGKGKDGNNYVKIVNSVSDDSRFFYALKVKPDQKYKVTCWAKAENIPTDESKAGANISLDGNLVTSKELKGTTDWQQLEFYFENKEPQNLTLTLGIGSYSRDNTGTAYFDDVKLEEVKDIPSNIKFAIAGGKKPEATKADSNIIWIIIFGIIALLVIGGFTLYNIKYRKAQQIDENTTDEDNYGNDSENSINKKNEEKTSEDDDDDTSL